MDIYHLAVMTSTSDCWGSKHPPQTGTPYPSGLSPFKTHTSITASKPPCGVSGIRIAVAVGVVAVAVVVLGHVAVLVFVVICGAASR